MRTIHSLHAYLDQQHPSAVGGYMFAMTDLRGISMQ